MESVITDNPQTRRLHLVTGWFVVTLLYSAALFALRVCAILSLRSTRETASSH